MPFSLPRGLASVLVALGALVLGAASVIVAAEPDVPSALTLLAEVTLPGVLFVTLAIRLARSRGRAAVYAMLASGATLACVVAWRFTDGARPGLQADTRAGVALGGLVAGFFLGVFIAPVVAAAAHVRNSHAYDNANTLLAIASLWLFLIVSLVMFALWGLSGPRWFLTAPRHPIYFVPLGVFALALAGIGLSVRLHRKRLAWLASVYEGRDAGWSIELRTQHPETGALPPLLENAEVLNGVLLMHAPDGAGPFRGAVTKVPFARVDLDGRRALGLRRQTIYGALGVVVLLVGLPVFGVMGYQLATRSYVGGDIQQNSRGVVPP